MQVLWKAETRFRLKLAPLPGQLFHPTDVVVIGNERFILHSTFYIKETKVMTA